MTPAAETTTRFTYLYCIVRGDRPSIDAAPAGIDGIGPLRLLPLAANMALVVADADAVAWSSESIATGLADLDWVARCALAHEAVVEHFAAICDVVPVKLFTLYASDDRAVADGRARQPAIGAALDRIAGRDEWGVRIASHARPPAGPSAGEPPTTGTDFLKRKAARRASSAQDPQAQQAADRAFEALVPLAVATCRLAIPDAPRARVLVDAAMLVPRDAAARLHERIPRLEDEHDVSITLTGPWPAYHFVEVSP